MTFTAEALTGYWNGTAEAGYWNGANSYGPSTARRQELRRIDSLEPAARINVLADEAMSLFHVTPGAEGQIVVSTNRGAGGAAGDEVRAKMLSLVPPDLEKDKRLCRRARVDPERQPLRHELQRAEWTGEHGRQTGLFRLLRWPLGPTLRVRDRCAARKQR